MITTSGFKFICPACKKETSLLAVQAVLEHRTVEAIELNEDGKIIGYDYVVEDSVNDNTDPVFSCCHCRHPWNMEDLTALKDSSAIVLYNK